MLFKYLVLDFHESKVYVALRIFDCAVDSLSFLIFEWLTAQLAFVTDRFFDIFL